MSGEPVLTVITAFVAATIGVLAAFGLDFTAAQVGAITGWVAAAYGGALLIRSRVRPVAARRKRAKR